MRHSIKRTRSWMISGVATLSIAQAIPLTCSAVEHQPDVSIASGINVQSAGLELGQPSIEVVGLISSTNELGQEQLVAQIRQSLNMVAYPTKDIRKCQDIAQIVRRAHSAHCLEQSLKRLLANCNHNECNTQLVNELARVLASKLEHEQIRKGLSAHVVIYSTMMLARQQLDAYSKLDEFANQQRVAIENGIAIRDPLALDETRLQLTDASVQTVGINRNMRSQLAILTKDQLICDYQPVLEACCTVPMEDLCELTAMAERNRAELQALRILDKLLLNSATPHNCRFCSATLSMLSSVPAVYSLESHGLLNRLLGTSNHEDQVRALRSAISSASKVMRDKVASEVSDAWHKAASAQARVLLAEGLATAASIRVTQLKEIGNEFASSPQVLTEAILAESKASADVIQREQERQISLIDLAYATGCL